MNSVITIGSMQPGDWNQVKSIYLEGIATGNATFETSAPSFAAWDKAHLPFARLVARNGDIIVGWAALSPVSSRCVYAGVADLSVYVAAASRGTGVGRKLLSALIDESEQNGIWTLQAGIFPENEGSLAIHRSCGFREVGRRERIGKIRGVWRDTILLERRSPNVGVD
jgi:L-amino acid N-acyltransferase YncA